jgi:hypothetical protein
MFGGDMSFRKQRGISDTGLSLLFAIVMLVVVCVICYIVAMTNCGARWKLSGFKTDYGVFQGCLVEVRAGVWVPSSNVRDIPLVAPK